MLIEFKVTNFRSIREQQALSLVASSDKELAANVIDPDLPGLAGVRLLKGAAIYGANASGKTNILRAIHFVAGFVNDSFTLKPEALILAQPFRLDRKSSTKPSEFEITFVKDGVRYVFGLALTSERVIEEYLIAYPKGFPQRWYHRTYNSVKKKYEWAKPSSLFRHNKSLEENTREKSLFLSVGTQLNHEQLRPVYDWFVDLRILNLTMERRVDFKFTTDLLNSKNPDSRILNLLRSADIGIINAVVEKKDAPNFLKHLEADVAAKLEADGFTTQGKVLRVSLSHQGDGVEPVPFDFLKEESAGTRRLFSLAGPWMDILDHGRTVFIDEIDTSLHPDLVRELLHLIYSKTHNPNGAQVIFTTHNPVLLDGSLMRRDQVWFTEKSLQGVTHLYPLTDYQPRKNEALVKGYLAGRYGAIPFLPEGLKL